MFEAKIKLNMKDPASVEKYVTHYVKQNLNHYSLSTKNVIKMQAEIADNLKSGKIQTKHELTVFIISFVNNY